MRTENRTESEAVFEEARELIPGGVNSPVRAWHGVGGTPVHLARGRGALVTDLDGNEYVDFVLAYGPHILGHGHPAVREALHAATDAGTAFGSPTAGERDLAELVVDRVPGVEMVRLVNSGTEATMSALRLARAATGRDFFVKFEGCYHGHGDSFLVQAGSGALTLGTPDSPGVPTSLARLTLVAPFNDLEAVRALFAEHGASIACIFVEPVAGNMGTVLPAPGFLEGLRRICDEHGALLVFDEVMTGFRVARGGFQDLTDVRCDLVTLGKVMGGGLPLAAYAGPASLMGEVAPTGAVYQAGTLSGNPLAVAAGIAALRALDEPDAYERLDAAGARLAEGLTERAAAHGLPLTVPRCGSMLCPYFAESPPRDLAGATAADRDLWTAFFHAMLKRGVHLAPSPFEAWFLSTAHDDAVLDRALAAADEAFGEIAP